MVTSRIYRKQGYTIIKIAPSMYHSWIMWLLIEGDSCDLWRRATHKNNQIVK